MGDSIVEKTSSNENENRITIDMCKKLFATKIVAKSFFGLDSKSLIADAFDAFFCAKSDKFFEVKERLQFTFVKPKPLR